MSRNAGQGRRRKERRTDPHGPDWKPKRSGRDAHPVVQLLEYEVTPEPIENPDPANRAFETFLGADRHQRLHDLIKEDPASAVTELECILDGYGPAPLLYNWLAAAYSRLGQHDKAEEMGRLNYERFPDYLFAKLNHAHTLLVRGQTQEVAQLMDNKFDLKLLYPQRTVFHLSEFTAMAALAIEYYLQIGESDPAEAVWRVLKKLNPDSEVTRHCERQIGFGRLERATRKLLAKRTRTRRPRG